MNDQIRTTNPPHGETVVAISRRLIPGMLAGAMFLIFVAFMIGYFLGVKYTTDEFVTQIRQETFADQLLAGSALSGSAPVSEPAISAANAPEEQPVETSATQPDATQVSAVEPTQPDGAKRYGAELIGFGTKGAANDFIKRVAQYSPIPLELKERHSKTSRGKVITWYQVVTSKYEQKQELQKLLDTLIKKEHLHDIKIVAYAPNTKDLA